MYNQKVFVPVLVLLSVLFLLANAAVKRPNAMEAPLTEQEARKLFEEFLSKHKRSYVSNPNEMQKRFNIFKTNVEKARFYNYMINDKVYGVTQFSDMDETEFRSKYLMKKPIHPKQMRDMLFKNGAVVSEKMTKAQVAAAPAAWDWREHGAVTPVKNQGACGSCWAFSATGNVEGQWYLATNKSVVLSEQNLVDCDHECDPKDPTVCDSGCNGGLMWNAFSYIIKNRGIATEESYPYLGYDDTCHYDNKTKGATISSWKMLPTDEDQLAAWLAKNGPVAVGVNAEWLQFYIGGISDPMWCSPDGLDHGVLLVGYGTGKTWLGGEKKYWIVKNSWGSSWGEQGYFRIARGGNTCGIAAVPSSSSV
jgi:cathepsin F